jgi:aromatic-L-amino-acid decarboxylase
MEDHSPLSPAQRSLGDMSVAEFRRAAHRVADQVADYLERLETYPVLPRVAPGEIRSQLPQSPPSAPEPLERALEDYARLPGSTPT